MAYWRTLTQRAGRFSLDHRRDDQGVLFDVRCGSVGIIVFACSHSRFRSRPHACRGAIAFGSAGHDRQHRLARWGSTSGRGGWEMDDDKRTRKAVAKLEKIVRQYERRYGLGARSTLNARTTLAHEYHAAGRTAEGIAMLEQAVGDSERLNGPDHRNTLNARMNLAFGFREIGETAEIIPVLEQIAADSERIFGPGHDEETLTPRLILALTYRENGRPGEAIPVLEQLLADRERITGLDPRETLNAKGYLALSYLEAGHADEAIALFEQIAPEVENFVSPYVLGTLSRLDVAPLYAAAGRTDEAIAAAEWGVDDLEYRYGPDDQLTIAARTLLAQLQAARQGS